MGHIISKRDFERMGGYDEDYVIMEDFEFYSRAKPLLGFEIIRKPQLRISSRTYSRNSYLKVQIINLLCVIKFRQGKRAEEIRRFYQRWMN